MLRPLSDHVHDARLRLLKAGIKVDEARLDAELLARHVLGWDRARYIAYRAQPLPERAAAAFEALVARREHREPLAYIVGTREFYGRDFDVSPAVLVPRPETELIVETTLELVSERRATEDALEGPGAVGSRPLEGSKPEGKRHADGADAVKVADVGTGSGCLAVTLAAEIPGAHVVALDVSPEALHVARRNAARHHVTDRVDLLQCDVRDGLPDGPFDIVVSNPPYVAADEILLLAPEVRDFEPRLALAGGADGLDVIRHLVRSVWPALRQGGHLVFEIGAGQAEAVQALLTATGFEGLRIRSDLQGHARTIVAHRIRERDRQARRADHLRARRSPSTAV